MLTIKVALRLTSLLPDVHQNTPHLGLIDARPEKQWWAQIVNFYFGKMQMPPAFKPNFWYAFASSLNDREWFKILAAWKVFLFFQSSLSFHLSGSATTWALRSTSVLRGAFCEGPNAEKCRLLWSGGGVVMVILGDLSTGYSRPARYVQS